MPKMFVDICKYKYNIKDSASAQNISVAFHQEYFKYHCLYFTIEKQWSKDLLNNNKEIFTNIPSKLEQRGNDRNYVE
jgi:hypothetical protein